MSRATIAELKKQFETGERSVREIVDEYLARIEEKNGELNVFLTVMTDEARKRADEIDKDLTGDKSLLSRKPLLGIPIAYKDLFLTKGVRTTAGSRVLEDYTPPYSATVVERLEEAGAIILGKTNQDAWGHGASGENSDFGPTKNPVNPEYVPGGSSSGSAAAVAAGMTSVAMGTDTGGSIRQPANFCGVVGFKPSYGRVSRYGVVAMASSMDSMGHLTNSVEDAAMVLAVTAGEDPLDANTKNSSGFNPEVLRLRHTRGVRVGMPKEYLTAIADAEVRKNFDAVVKKLEQLGAEVIEVSLPHTELAIAIYYIVQPAEVSSNLARYDGIRYGRGRDAFGAEAKRRIEIGNYTLSAGYYDAYYASALKARTLVRRDFDQVFEKVDVLVAPVSPTPAFKLGEKKDPISMYLADILTCPANLAGVPGLALPTGKTTAGVPLGIQILGPAGKDESVFPLAYQLEQSLK